MRGELAEEGALAEAGITVEDSDLAGGETAGREPLHGLGIDLTQADDVARWLPPQRHAIRFHIIEIRLGNGHGVPLLLPGFSRHQYRTYVLILEVHHRDNSGTFVALVMGSLNNW